MEKTLTEVKVESRNAETQNSRGENVAFRNRYSIQQYQILLLNWYLIENQPYLNKILLQKVIIFI